MSKTAQQIAVDAVKLVDVFLLYGDKVGFLLNQLNKIANQPRLTIRKSIAEKIDKFIKVLHFLNEFEAIKYLSALDLNGDRTPQWLKDNPMLVFAYLAGKALGVEIVEVVEE
ncbi:hypothetical protein [Lactococcus protaetiae]|uniref:hypothetical protein n=1 Tax=Lactococcus protaetiae TaxID=2592653 RepID=UPI001680F90B|nr:hypothetical protein [Lactococcus protaetiae]